MNNEQMKGYYSQATKMAEELYEHLTETFAETPCVVYCVSVNRWNNHVTVDVWISIGNKSVSDEVRELVGNVVTNCNFATYSKDNADEFVQEVKDKAEDYLRKAKGVQGIIDREH